MKKITAKAVCLSLAVIILTAAGTPIPVERKLEPKITASAVMQSFDSAVERVEVKSCKTVKGVPDSQALDYLEEVPYSAFEDIGAQLNKEQDPDPLTSISAFIELYKKGINSLQVYLFNHDENLSEFYCEYDDDNGEHHIFASGIYYDKTTKLIYGKDGNGCFALGFDLDTEQLTFYTAVDAWQRDFGFCELYDILAPALRFDYQTVRVKFTYDNYEWMIQIWKGYYIIANGAEIALYNKPVERLIEFYDSAQNSQMMPMGLRLYKKNGELYYELDMNNNWWVSGFTLKDMFKKEDLYLEGDLMFPNEDMFNAFMASFEPVALENGIEYVTNGLIVSFDW